MALLMLNTLKTTRLLNVFLTENYTKTWNVKWCPLTTVWIEIQHHSRSKAGDFTPASCGTHRLHGKGWCVEPGPEPASPRCWAPSRGASREHLAAQHCQEKGTHPFVLPATEGQATPEKLHRGDQPTVSLCAVECFDQELSGKENRQENYRQPQQSRQRDGNLQEQNQES